MKAIHQIVKKPLVTEKTSIMKETDNVISFKVALDANKIEIKQAVEKAFDVKVVKVNTTVIAGKTKRVGYNVGKRSNYKKAFVTLAEGNDIEFYGV